MRHPTVSWSTPSVVSDRRSSSLYQRPPSSLQASAGSLSLPLHCHSLLLVPIPWKWYGATIKNPWLFEGFFSHVSCARATIKHLWFFEGFSSHASRARARSTRAPFLSRSTRARVYLSRAIGFCWVPFSASTLLFYACGLHTTAKGLVLEMLATQGPET